MEINAQYNWWRRGEDFNPNGVNIMTQDWDYCIVLDALRHDLMVKECSLPGQLSQAISRGAGTREWLRGNFREKEFHDTVYVNANPQLDRLASELDVGFHSVENVWESEWNDELQTVKPESVRESALEAAERYPNKRILIHFLQPHEPFIGPTGKEHDFGGVAAPDDSPYTDRFLEPFLNSVWLNQDEDLLLEAYKENLQLALSEVELLFEELEGKFVVTSDHGELMGERVSPIPVRYYGHRIGCHHPNLITVPWLEYENGKRREVTNGTVSAHTNTSSENDVKSRLRYLGYTE